MAMTPADPVPVADRPVTQQAIAIDQPGTTPSCDLKSSPSGVFEVRKPTARDHNEAMQCASPHPTPTAMEWACGLVMYCGLIDSRGALSSPVGTGRNLRCSCLVVAISRIERYQSSQDPLTGTYAQIHDN